MSAIHTFVVLAYKQSKYLENCIISCLNQKYPSKVVIATSTPNQFIDEIAKKYNLEVIVGETGKGIASDFNFALHCIHSDIITIAHQDDFYENDYSYSIIQAYKKYSKSLIIFSGYYELRENNKVYSNTNLKIKKFLLLPLRLRMLSGFRFIKRLSISLGNPLCCPAVSYVQRKMPEQVFFGDMKSNVDWLAWENLSKKKGNFLYIHKPLMAHRIHEESTTTKIINNNVRTQEDLEIFKKFWPTKIAKFINNFYKKSEESNHR